LRVDGFASRRDVIEIRASSQTSASNCPQCGAESRRIHARYERTIADLPWHGVAVRLRLAVHKFKCDTPGCVRTVFTERFPELTQPYARRTTRLAATIELLGFALGGRAGARIAAELGNAVSPDTLIRAVRRAVAPASGEPRVLGVDDWAIRRGHTYATILIDLETHRPIDVLPDRKAETLAAWLKAHPGVEVVSRDRGGSYAEGAKAGAPNATQIADRWHLLKNLGDALERYLATNHKELIAVTNALRARPEPDESDSTETRLPTSEARTTRVQEIKQVRRAKRHARYEQVKALIADGATIKAVARATGMDVKTVRKFARAEQFPERAQRAAKPTSIDPFVDYLRQRWAAGCRNACALWREIQQRGYSLGVSAVRRLVATWRQGDGRGRWKRDAPPGPTPLREVKPLSPRTAKWILLREVDDLDAEEIILREKLLEVCPGAPHALPIVSRFQAIVRERNVENLTAWIEEAKGCGIADLVGFANGLERDRSAVEAALRYEWSNGPVEGHVNRIKVIKRQMYGRANFDLLRKRILGRS
jgi:transposase